MFSKKSILPFVAGLHFILDEPFGFSVGWIFWIKNGTIAKKKFLIFVFQ